MSLFSPSGSRQKRAVSTAASITAADLGKLIDVTASGSAVTISLDDAAVLGDGFWFALRRNPSSNADVIVDPYGAQQIDGAATLTISDSAEGPVLQCDGTGWAVLRGRKGDTGAQGPQGIQGPAGEGAPRWRLWFGS